MNKKFFVVGDKFFNYEGFENCTTFSELIRKLKNQDFVLSIVNGNQYLPGQGLQDEQIIFLKKTVERMNLSMYFDAWYFLEKNNKVLKHLTHKQFNENVLITEPIKLDENTYEMYLRINDENEIMSDHVSGYHIQGMLLMESARQSFLAVTEKYFMTKSLYNNSYFIINEFAANFKSFVFPFEIKLVYKIINIEKSDSLKLKFSVTVEIHQMERVASYFDISFSVFHKPWILNTEKNRSAICAKYYAEECAMFSTDNNIYGASI